jgi:hypothetical protein
MSKLIYIKNDKSPLFAKMVSKNAALAIDSMVSNIERNSKKQVPVSLTKGEGGSGKSSGQLRSSFFRVGAGKAHQRIGYAKRYAAFQEFGGDGKRVIKRHSRPGKKSFFLRDPVNTELAHASMYWKKYLGRKILGG